MTQQEKDLLFKDLCAKLPFGVKEKCENINVVNGNYPFDNDISISRGLIYIWLATDVTGKNIHIYRM